MEIETLKKVITDQRNDIEALFKREKIVEREGLSYAKKFLTHPNVLAVLGVRRCGKSIFSLLLAGKIKFAYINFDDERLLNIKAEDLNKVLQAFYELYGDFEIIVLDEIQNIFGWELFASRLRLTKRVIITGSSSQLLSGELATKLTGRHISFTLYPFSFREYISFKPDIYLTRDIAKARSCLERYALESGFPEFPKFGSEIVARIYGDAIEKDCIRRHNIRERKTFKELSLYMVSNFSSEFTYSKLAKAFGIKDVHTSKNYVSYLVDAFIIAVLERFSPKLKAQAIAPKKVYTIDQGICNFISFRLSKDIGKIYENIVCIELLRKKAINQSLSIHYWKNLQQEEVDFVIKKRTKVAQLIQVCYDISAAGTKEREIKALLKAGEELRCKDFLIITGEKEGVETVKGKKIKYIPLWKWLIK